MMVTTIRRQRGEMGTSTGSGRMTDQRVEWHLQNWALWMRSGGVNLGCGESVGLSSGGGQANFDDLADAAERRVADVCNVVIEGLPPGQQMALSNKYLHAVYRFHRTTQAGQLWLAKESVRAGLMRRGIW